MISQCLSRCIIPHVLHRIVIEAPEWRQTVRVRTPQKKKSFTAKHRALHQSGPMSPSRRTHWSTKVFDISERKLRYCKPASYFSNFNSHYLSQLTSKLNSPILKKKLNGHSITWNSELNGAPCFQCFHSLIRTVFFTDTSIVQKNEFKIGCDIF